MGSWQEKDSQARRHFCLSSVCRMLFLDLGAYYTLAFSFWKFTELYTYVFSFSHMHFILQLKNLKNKWRIASKYTKWKFLQFYDIWELTEFRNEMRHNLMVFVNNIWLNIIVTWFECIHECRCLIFSNRNCLKILFA